MVDGRGGGGLAWALMQTVEKTFYRTWGYRARGATYAGLVAQTLRRFDVGRWLVVDVGCGDGWLWGSLEGFRRVVGIDISGSRLRHFRGPGVLRVQGTATNLPLKDGTVDVLLAFSLVEHLPDRPPFFQESLRVLKPGGLALLELPEPRFLVETHTKWPLLYYLNAPLRARILAVAGCPEVDLKATVDCIVREAREAGFGPPRVRPLRHFRLAWLVPLPMGYFLQFRKVAEVAAGPIGQPASRGIETAQA